MNAALHETMKDTFARGIDRAMKSGASGASVRSMHEASCRRAHSPASVSTVVLVTACL